MKKTTELKLLITAMVVIVGTTSAFSKDEIRTYSVPKSHPAVPKGPMANADGIPVNASPVQWTTPRDWQELPANGIRLGNLLVPGKDGKKAEVTIMSFPGDVGGELANVNRWRGELGLAPVTDKEVSSQTVKVGADDAKLYDFSGEKARTVVASLPRNGSTWFFKLRGDKDVVTGGVDTFLEFLKTVHFDGKGAAVTSDKAPSLPHASLGDGAADPHAGIAGAPPLHSASAKSSNGAAADPHAGIAGAPPLHAAAADAGNSEEPKWQIPSNWKAKQPGMMVLKSFTVSNDGKDATVSISVFPGDVGGTFGNVNRWRGQIGLPPVTEDELPKVTTTVKVDGDGNATMVDFNGTDARSGAAARLVALAVPHGDSTWFYKLLGDGAVVAHEKEAFLKFVQTVRYP